MIKPSSPPGDAPSVNPAWVREYEGLLAPVKDLKGKFCHFPFNKAQVHCGGEVTVCCPVWLPLSIGYLGSAGLMDIWNSDTAQKIRNSILDGSFRYCNHRTCILIQSDSLPGYSELAPEYREIVDRRAVVMDRLPEGIMLAYDRSCNLSCPSCRSGRICFDKGSPEYEEAQRFTDLIMKELLDSDRSRKTVLNITGSGDPFASPVFRNLLETFPWERLPNLKIDFQTNGTLFTEKMWGALHKIHKSVRDVSVSVDAATPETYASVRRGGNWAQLMANLEFLYGLRRGNRVHSVQFNFVVQQKNFREMPLFIKRFLGKVCDNIEFSFLNDWGTWETKEQYERQCVWKKDHPEFSELMRVLRDPVFDHPDVWMGDVYEYRMLALGKAYPRRAPLRGADLYLWTNDPRLFRLSFLLNPVFVVRRLKSIGSWRDLGFRLRNLLRLLKLKLNSGR